MSSLYRFQQDSDVVKAGFKAIDKDRVTALMFAENGHTATVQALLAVGADASAYLRDNQNISQAFPW
jgi:hypothetical protein